MHIPRTDRQEDLLRRYLSLLMEENRRFNLTAFRDRDQAWERLVLESLPLAAWLPAGGGRVADLGSGGGIPGIPLAVMRPDLHFTLIEASTKKAGFIERAVANLVLSNVAVLARRAEQAALDPAHAETYDVVTARAVAPLDRLLGWAMPLLREGGELLAVKGRRAAEEVTSARTRTGAWKARIAPPRPLQPGLPSLLVRVTRCPLNGARG